jgi:tape measure domain-containing protein
MAGQQDIGALVVTLEAQTAAFEKGMAQATKSLQGFGAASKAVESQLGGIQGAFLKFNVATAAISTGMSAISSAFGKLRSFASVRENLDNIQASFTAVLGSGERAADMMERVMRISNELGSDLPSTANAIRRMAIGLKQLGSTNDEIERISTTFLKIGAIGGSIEEATAAIFQFSQALGSGTLRGDELISLLERQPLIAQEIAKYLQKIGLSADGTIGSLRKLASEGKVTSTLLKEALLDAEERIAEAYAGLPLKISQALNKLKNRLDQFYIEINKEFKINEAIGSGLTQLLSAVEPALANLSQFIKDVAKNFEIVQAVALGLGIAFANVLVPAVWSLVAASAAFIATPLGLAIAGIGATILAVVAYWKELRTAIINTAISVLEYAAVSKEAFGFDSSNLRAMIINLEAAKMEMEELGKKTEEVPKKLSDAEKAAKKAAEAAKKFQEAVGKSWESFIESLQKVRIETSLVDAKIRELEKLVSTEKDPRLLKQWKEMLDQIKASSLSAFEAWEQGVKKLNFGDTTADMEKQIKVYRELAAATDDAILSTKYLNQAKKMEAEIADSIDPLAGFKRSLDETINASDLLVAKFYLIDEAVTRGLDPEKAEKMKEALLGVDSAAKQVGESIADAIASNANNAVNSFIDNIGQAKLSFSDFAEAVLKDIAKMIVQILVITPLIKSLKAAMSGMSLFGGGGGIGGLIPLSTPAAASVDSRSMTVESAMPISSYGSRSAMMRASIPSIQPFMGGNKSVASAPSAASSETIVNVYNSADATVKTAETTNADGSKQIDIMIEKKVKELFGTGAMDKSMRASYGLVRAAS